VKDPADGLGRGLPREIDLEGAVDGHHVVLPGDEQRVVRVVDLAEVDGRIVMDVVVGGPLSHAERGHRLPRVDGLARVVDDALLHQLDDAVAQELRVDPEVFLSRQIGKDGIRNGPVTHLDRVAVLDESGHVSADPLGNFRLCNFHIFQDRFVMGDHEIHVVHVDKRVAVDPGHEAVDLDHHEAGRLRGRLHDVHADPQAHVTVLVGRGGLDQGHVHPFEAPAEKGRKLGQEDGRVVGYPLVDGLARAVADEKGVVSKVLFELLRGVGGNAEGPDAEYLGVEKSFGMGLDETDKALDEVLGFGARGSDEDRVPPMDVLKHGLFRCEFVRIRSLPVLKGSRHAVHL